MAVVTSKSTSITNRDALPAVLNEPSVEKGKIQESEGFAAFVNGNSIASKYILASVPSNARLSQVLMSCDAMGALCTVDFGFYRNTKDGGAVIDADFLATAVDTSAALKHSDVTNESGTNTVALQEQPLWQALGFTADPETDFDLVGTLVAAAAASGNLGIKARFVLG